jgi:hypothetical protein
MYRDTRVHGTKGGMKASTDLLQVAFYSLPRWRRHHFTVGRCLEGCVQSVNEAFT